MLNEEDLRHFRGGTHDRLWEHLGAHATRDGTQFSVWAPGADEVAVAGTFSGGEALPLGKGPSGIWSAIVEGARPGAEYRYRVRARDREFWKADPFAFYSEAPPGTASIVWPLDYDWQDRDWMKWRRKGNDEPMAIYEVHLGSWRRTPEEEGARPLTYREIAPQLAGHVRQTGFTHVELMPVMEHPFYGSWGYQVTGFFAATHRYGTPQDLMYMIGVLHREGIGVILDWVPSHFAGDVHGLAEFDGARLYESGESAQWGGHAFDYTRGEVLSFLRSSAAFWLERYHADGLRLDAVAGIRERPGGKAFLRELNAGLARKFPQAVLIAEDSSPEPGVTAPVNEGGLGFDRKWDMGWMHDTLSYMSGPASARPSHHGRLTFRPLYLWNERWVLPLSHDEVKPPFGSLLSRMPGSSAQKFANVRLLLAWMYAQPGAKLLFMGGEFAEPGEWQHDRALDWRVLEGAAHYGVRTLVEVLNRTYRAESALHEAEASLRSFTWIDCCDEANSVVTFLRRGRTDDAALLAVFNFSTAEHADYRVGVPFGRAWKQVVNTDDFMFGGQGRSTVRRAPAEHVQWQNRLQSIRLLLPPLTAILLKPEE